MALNSYRPGADLFSGTHAFICGATRQGKTHFIRQRLRNMKKPVIFFNPQKEPLGPGWVRVDSRSDWGRMLDALRSGHKLNYIPALDNKRAACELAVLIDSLFESGWTEKNNMILAIDECHLARAHEEGDRAIELVATRGIRFGICCVFATQRPAYAHKAAYTQADLHVMFRTNMEKGYFSAKGIPYADYNAMIAKGGKYSYAVFDGLEMLGPFKE